MRKIGNGVKVIYSDKDNYYIDCKYNGNKS